MLKNLKITIEKTFNFRINDNQLRDIHRLIFEIMTRERCSLSKIVNNLKNTSGFEKYTGKNKFLALKKTLIAYRFPLTSSQRKINPDEVFLNELRAPLTSNISVSTNFKPLKIFAEKETQDSPLLKNFQKRYPNLKVKKIENIKQYLTQNKFKLWQLKCPSVFITKERADFIKICPCTKDHLRCGYWIFNLGYGCPFDCSYCYLQQYSNFPGIILPANIDCFLEKFDGFSKRLKEPLRIGTGEFSDSLALDHITEYSLKLIPYFKDKNVLFEFKTKSAQINNLLKIKSSPNIIISWSLNPQILIKTQEKATASLDKRLEAAKKVQSAGYGVGFHFDPIIHIPNWQRHYRLVIEKLYSQLKPPFAWISLGTLRSHRELKTIVEVRFPESNIFYGELLLGKDKKLRYPEFLREEIYRQMVQWIRDHDKKTPVYLCMESKTSWQKLEKFNSKQRIENYLLRPR